MRIQWGSRVSSALARAGGKRACRIAGLVAVLMTGPVPFADAQAPAQIFADRYGHQETARDVDWRMVPRVTPAQGDARRSWREEDREPQRGGERQRHRVETGETLFRIARRYDVTVEDLQRANRIDDPTTLRVGQELVIPQGQDSAGFEPRSQSRRSQPRRAETSRSDSWREQGPRRATRDEPDQQQARGYEPDRRETDWRESDNRERGRSDNERGGNYWREEGQRETYGYREPPPMPDQRPEQRFNARDNRDTRPSVAGLRELAGTMHEPAGARRTSEIPAGYTFFAQLVGADLEVDRMLAAWLNERDRARRVSAELDLDIIYGGGPQANPERFYLPYIRTGARLSESGKRYALSRHMPPAGHAFVTQLQAALIELHNRAADLLIERHFARDKQRYCDGDCTNAELASKLPETKRQMLFKDARDTVIHYYHRVIVEDMLPRLIGEERAKDIISNGRDVFFPSGFGEEGDTKTPFIPYEFALAAYRFTDSQMAARYQLREGERARRFSPQELSANSPRQGRLEPDALADWRYFVDILPEPPQGFNRARPIDPYLASAQSDRYGGGAAEATLVAGARAGLPSGQTVAGKVIPSLRKRGMLYLWSAARQLDGEADRWQQYALSPDRPTRQTVGRETPLWYYVLREARAMGGPTGFGADSQAYALSASDGPRYADARESRMDRGRDAGGGHTLGPVGGTIVGEVLIGLAEHYAIKTGKGLGFRPPIGASAYGERDRFTLTRVRADSGELGERYLLRNLLIDAGVAVALP